MQDIYSRLLAGETIDDIMSDLTAQANEAQNRYNEFQKLEAERLRLEEEERKLREQAEREAKAIAKHETMVDLINNTLYFIAEHYPSFGYTVEEVDKIDDATIHALANLAIGILDAEEAGSKRKSAFKVNLPFPGAGLRSNLPVMDEAIKPCNLPDNGVTVSAATTSAKPEPSADDIFAQFFKGFPFN